MTRLLTLILLPVLLIGCEVPEPNEPNEPNEPDDERTVADVMWEHSQILRMLFNKHLEQLDDAGVMDADLFMEMSEQLGAIILAAEDAAKNGLYWDSSLMVAAYYDWMQERGLAEHIEGMNTVPEWPDYAEQSLHDSRWTWPELWSEQKVSRDEVDEKMRPLSAVQRSYSDAYYDPHRRYIGYREHAPDHEVQRAASITWAMHERKRRLWYEWYHRPSGYAK